MIRQLAIVAVILAAAGCAADAPEAIVMGGAAFVQKGERLGVVEEFSLGGGADVSYRFDVDDGGAADACFVPLGSADKWLGERARASSVSGPAATPVKGLSCVWAKQEGISVARLEKGAWEFVVRAHSCPALDCRLQWGVEGAEVTSARTAHAPPASAR